MRLYLITTQVVYAVSTAVWAFVWMMSFMMFDQGIQFLNTLFFLGVSIYPIVVVLSIILSWKLRKRRLRLAIVLNLIPMIWIVPFVILMTT
ncbi:hypothetical protein [Paenibacillus albus]|uniref:Uncharacterized protein n=1 Tax=Paenibacillus albus TaxID=2495582 RepID=A0A3Q8X9U3_9BACL|nr:hypothetical protein [Paenibacillus albus]AZN43273.1 hypothetical protein EJC50_28975 [Paenibacillus albus]